MERRLRRIPDEFNFFGLLPALSVLPRRLGARLIRYQGRYLQSSLGEHAELIRRHLALCGFDNPGQKTQAFFEVLAGEDLDAFYFKRRRPSNIDQYLVSMAIDVVSPRNGRCPYRFASFGPITNWVRIVLNPCSRRTSRYSIASSVVSLK
jgi:hypothetical protein